jgi:putative tryptophan/tyrosine transport system substrate-binding protein
MRRRQFITLVGGAAAWPLAARAQQPAVPVIGYLSSRSQESDASFFSAFRQGLSEAGYVENRNVTIEYRFAGGQYDQLPAMAADLIRRQVTVIATSGGGPSVRAAKAATATVPIVFQAAIDPVEVGLVVSLNRPGGNVTGVTNLNLEVEPKRLELLHQVVPTANAFAVLVNPANPPNAEATIKGLQTAATALGLQLHILRASSERDIDAAFVSIEQKQIGGLVVSNDAFFTNRSQQLTALALRHGVPAIYGQREFAVAGGLMSYEGNILEAYLQFGHYTGRVLKGEKPADLPVQQVTKLELIVNMITARALGVTVPTSLLAIADEVIE